MPIILLQFFLTSSIVLLLTSCATLNAPSAEKLIQDDYSLVKQYMTKFIKREMKRSDFTGLSIALVDDQEIVWSDGFGLADKATQRKAAPETLYRAGSVSKLITAIAVMQLVEAGKIDLDAPLVRYVPEFNLKSRYGSTDGITLRNTLAHHSGLPGNIVEGMWTKNPASFKEVATRLGNYYAASPPNTVFAYSNAGYSLAGHAVENVSGMPYTQYVEHHVLAPLGMGQSNMSYNTDSPLLANSYWEGEEVQELPLRDLPAGGLVTSVVDLSRLVMAMHSLQAGNPGVVLPDSFSSMITPAPAGSPYIVDNLNGLGFFVSHQFLEGQFRAAGHDGQTMAHSASVVSIPEIKLGVVILGNSPNITGIYQRITTELLNVAYPVKTGNALEVTSNTTKTSLPGTDTTFNGDFISELGFIKIRGDASRYFVNVDGEKMILKPDRDNDYQLSVKLLGFLSISPGQLKKLRFHAREVNEKKIIVVDSGLDRQLLATQTVTQQVNEAWHARLGEYKITNPIDTDIELFTIERPALQYIDGYYMITSNSNDDKSRLLLNIINDNEATIQGLGRGLGETIFAKDDGTIIHSGLIFKKL